MITIYYYIGGELLHGKVTEQYIVESRETGTANIFGNGIRYNNIKTFIHPTEGVFYVL